MTSYYGVTIPEELASFKKDSGLLKIEHDVSGIGTSKLQSDVVVKRNVNGGLESVDYYCDYELVKQILYTGSSISKIKLYKNKQVHIVESYSYDLIKRKDIYDSKGDLAYYLKFGYTNDNKICDIIKDDGTNTITAHYKYDDFGHIASREILYNSEKRYFQNYRYDILDRITEYQDENQKIIVKKLTRKNQLIHYQLTDNAGNLIEVHNTFVGDEYVKSCITLNNHSIDVINSSYTEHIALKRPYATEEDLDIIVNNLTKKTPTTLRVPTPPPKCNLSTKRTDYQQILNRTATNIIDSNIKQRILPISLRKRMLFSIATS